MSFSSQGVPIIDPTVRYVGVSKLRELKADKLRSLEQTLVIQDDEKPLAVVLTYKQFLEMQEERDRILTILESFWRKEADIPMAIQEAEVGDTVPLNQVLRRPLKERKAINALPSVEPRRVNGKENKTDTKG